MMDLMQLLESERGYTPLREIAHGEAYEQRLTEVVRLLSNADNMPAHRREYMIREALTTSDFPYLFGDVLDRQVLASYKAVDPVWKAFTRMSTNRDFKASDRYAITGGDQYLAEVGEKGEYLASSRSEAKYSLTLKKYGRQFDISWEAMINDDLGALKDTPERFARAAVRTEHRLATGQYARNATIFSIARGNASGLVPSIANLETAVSAMVAYQDGAGEPIMNRPKYLVCRPAEDRKSVV